MSVQITPSGTRGIKVPAGVVKVATRLMVVLHRLLPRDETVLVTTVGAKTGQRRTVPVRRFKEPSGSMLVVGSKGGSATHPSWFYNMAKNPDSVWIDVKGKQVRVVPVSIRGDERATAWKRIVAEASGFASYETKTDREIPVVRLTSAEAA